MIGVLKRSFIRYGASQLLRTVSKSVLTRRVFKALTQVHKPREALSRFWRIHEYTRFFSDDRRHEEKLVGLSNEPGYISLSAIIEQAKQEKQSKIFFKIDVEGWEYRLFDQLIDNATLITGLAVEFHDVDLHMDRLRDFVSRFPLTLVHTHCNNFVVLCDKGTPLSIECTFTASKVWKELVSTLPGALDMPNNKDKEDYQLIFYDS